MISLQIFVADLVNSFGGVKSSLSYLMLLTIITGSFVLGPAGGLIFALTGGLFLGPFMPMNSELSLMQNSPNWIFRMIIYVFIGSYSGAIMNYLLNTINKLSKITFYHTKTNLPNLKYFENIALTNYSSDAYFANLKFENYEKTKETFGGNYADDFINFFSKGLSDVFGKKNLATVFYLGGGRFGIIFSSSEINSKFKIFFKTVLKKIRKKEIEYFPSMFIGVAKLEGNNIDILQNSEIARRSAKKNLNHYEIYSEEMKTASHKNFDLLCEIPRAIEKKEFYILYHPKIDLYSGKVEGVEALIRWDHPERGAVSPDDFIPHIEQTAMIGKVTEWVLKTALMDLKKMQLQGMDLRVSVNIPLNLLQNPKLTKTIKEYNKKILPLDKLEFEILERGSVDDFKNTAIVMESLKSMGIQFSLDDFGTGNSTLTCVQNLPLDIIKIDRTFVKDIETNRKNKELVRSCINIGRALDKKIVAEGVESEEVIKILKDMGCDCAQGYYFTKPLTYNKFLNWYKTYTDLR
ncbi:GGDEF domain-containing phosphodiesterase [Psychrilyobacter sp. S5]|nr:GGDEF domain-containing phosphodiesterase [Psychrilyobacter sp. S5]